MKTTCIIFLLVLLLKTDTIFCEGRIKQRFSETIEAIKRNLSASRENVNKSTSKEIAKIRTAERKSLNRVDVTINDALKKISTLQNRSLTFSPSSRQSTNVCVAASRNTLRRLQAETKSRLRSIASVAVDRVLSTKADVLRMLSSYLGLVNGLLVRFAGCGVGDVGCYGEVLGEAANTLAEVVTDLPFSLVSVLGNISEIAQNAVGNLGGIASAFLTTAMETLNKVASCIDGINTG